MLRNHVLGKISVKTQKLILQCKRQNGDNRYEKQGATKCSNRTADFISYFSPTNYDRHVASGGGAPATAPPPLDDPSPPWNILTPSPP